MDVGRSLGRPQMAGGVVCSASHWMFATSGCIPQMPPANAQVRHSMQCDECFTSHMPSHFDSHSPVFFCVEVWLVAQPSELWPVFAVGLIGLRSVTGQKPLSCVHGGMAKMGIIVHLSLHKRFRQNGMDCVRYTSQEKTSEYDDSCARE